MAPPPGRRPGKPATRGAIVRAASKAFAQHGYDGASLRAIAADAGVDPALIAHYFGGKEQLFLECVHIPIDPKGIVDVVLSGGLDEAGEHLVRLLLQVWDSASGMAAMSLLRSATQHEASARMMREFLYERVLHPVMAAVSDDPAEAAWRANLIASQVAGLLLTRYILKLEPTASADVGTVAGLVGPTLQRYLTGEVDLPNVS